MTFINEIFNKILYINGGLDFSPLALFPSCKYFVYTDTLPRNDDDQYLNKESKYRPLFTKRLVQNLGEKGFILNSVDIVDNSYGWKVSNWHQRLKHLLQRFISGSPNLYSICPTRYVFYHMKSDTMIVYFTSTDTRYNMLPILKAELKLVDGLILHQSCKHDVFNAIYDKKNPVYQSIESGMVRVHMCDMHSVMDKLDNEDTPCLPRTFRFRSKVDVMKPLVS